MRLLTWNARSFGNQCNIQSLSNLVWREILDVLFLQETRLSSKEFELCKFKLGFVNYFAIDLVGSKGGIVLLWSSDVVLNVINYSSNHIHACIELVGLSVRNWFLSAVYGFFKTHLRHGTWSLLCRLNSGTVTSPFLRLELSHIYPQS